MKQVQLNNGTTIPAVGFGTWKIFPNGRARKAVSSALAAGYRHIDTARIYNNEQGVGRAIRESGIERSDIFLTTKLWNSNQGYKQAFKAFDASLKRLDMDYVDLYLLHWPVTGKRLDSWRALEELNASGRAKAIGVSNFTIRHLEELIKTTKVVPVLNQVEFHPFLFDEQKELLEYCTSKGIVLEAYCPLAHGHRLDDPTLAKIAKKHKVSPAQAVLRWAIQHGTVVLPKSTNPERVAENIDIFGFELTDEDMDIIDSLGDGTRICGNPNDMQ